MGALNPDVSTIDRTRSHVWARQLQNTRTKRGVQPTAPTVELYRNILSTETYPKVRTTDANLQFFFCSRGHIVATS